MESTLEDTVTQEVPTVKRPQRKLDVEAFIKKSLPTFNRPVIKITMANVTPSYWRVNVWGKKLNSECAYGDNEIICSKFIRIDVDKDGQYVYNDVTDGKEV